MFNPKRIVQFLSAFVTVHLPVLVLVITLALLTRLLGGQGRLVEQFRTWQFWTYLVRDIVPTLVALLAVQALAARFVKSLYQLDTLSDARGFVRHSLFGLPAFAPWLRVAGGKAEGGEKHILTSTGGPGHLVIYNDNAVLLERGGRFTRVETNGFPKLGHCEKVYEVVDLRVKQKTYSVTAMSKEGIPLTCDADITFQIDCDGRPATYELPFPTSDSKVFQAATCTWIREANRSADSRVMDWAGRVIISETEGNLRTILARYPLDRLVGLLSRGDENPREEVRAELEQKLREAVPKLGAKILSVELGDIKVQDDVTQQWIELWTAEWERCMAKGLGEARAKRAAQIEDAKTRAQIMLLATITDAFEPLVDQQQTITSKLVLARLFMVLSRAPGDPFTRVNLPREAVHTLQLLKGLIV